MQKKSFRSSWFYWYLFVVQELVEKNCKVPPTRAKNTPFEKLKLVKRHTLRMYGDQDVG